MKFLKKIFKRRKSYCFPFRKIKLKLKPKNKLKNENALSIYGKDLTESAQKGLLDPVIGRENEINNLMRVLSEETKIILFL